MTDLIQRLKGAKAARHPHATGNAALMLTYSDVDTLLALLDPLPLQYSLRDRLSAVPSPNVTTVVMTAAERDQVLRLLAGPTQTVVRTLSDLMALVDEDDPGRAYPVSLYPGRVMEAVEADRAFANAVRQRFSIGTPDDASILRAATFAAAEPSYRLATQIRQAVGGKLSDDQVSQTVQRALDLTRIVDGWFPQVEAIADGAGAVTALGQMLADRVPPSLEAFRQHTHGKGCGPVTAAEIDAMEALDTDRLEYLFSDDCPEILWRALPVVDLDQGREIIDRVRNA